MLGVLSALHTCKTSSWWQLVSHADHFFKVILVRYLTELPFSELCVTYTLSLLLIFVGKSWLSFNENKYKDLKFNSISLRPCIELIWYDYHFFLVCRNLGSGQQCRYSGQCRACWLAHTAWLRGRHVSQSIRNNWHDQRLPTTPQEGKGACRQHDQYLWENHLGPDAILCI